ncbi:MAG: threonine synthase [Aigarchaeota archaeon]|nr:threonine synthase [Aigarchaeota archaeon]MDW8092836.1 threonine synthase [Nitrososphaerota archaeon]
MVTLICRECNDDKGHAFVHVCSDCFGALEVQYDLSKVRLNREVLANRYPSMWKYKELLPIVDDSKIVDIGAGNTPLIRADKLAKKIGVKRLYLKNDTTNPTYSFKDRPSSVAISKALEFKLSTVGCASTGNLAGATAAHAAKAGIDCLVFMPVSVEQSKVQQAAIYGARVVLIRGTYDDVNRLAALAADRFGIGIVNVNLRPYYVEGSKTMAFEIVEQLGWRTPDRIVVPTASGALLSALYKGLKEAEQIGLLKESNAAMTVAQPLGCSPIVEAFRNNYSEIRTVTTPSTIVQSLAIGDPGDGYQALKVVRESGGSCGAVTDVEALKAVELLASTEGVFAEVGGAISIAVLKRLVDEGEVGRDEEVVCCVTGSGFKTIDVLPRPENITTIDAKFDQLSGLLRTS